MTEVIKTHNDHNYDMFYIKVDNEIFEISFQNNLDLYFRYIPRASVLNGPKSKTITITKENYFLYNIFDELYNDIKENNNLMTVKTKNSLIKNETIEWYSDDFSYEEASSLKIKPNKENYELTFTKSNNDDLFLTYAVRISNSGSRYYPFNTYFMNLYNKLKEYEPMNHQVHFEEYLYKQKTLKHPVL